MVVGPCSWRFKAPDFQIASPCIFSFLGLFFLDRVFTLLVTAKGKKEYTRLSPSSQNSFYYFFSFLFKGLKFKTQFKVEF